MVDVLRERGAVISAAGQMLSSGLVNLDTLPGLVLRIIRERMWQQHAIPQKHWAPSREFSSFEEFVVTPPLDGLGTTAQALKDLCRRNPEAQSAIEEETQHSPGDGPSKALSIVQGFEAPTGNTQSAALRRLRKERPDLLARVKAGELSAHAAAIEAGHRSKTISVPVSKPEKVAATLRRHMTSDQLNELIRLLEKDDHGSDVAG